MNANPKTKVFRFLRVAIVVIAVLCLLFFFLVLPWVGQAIKAENPEFSWAFWPCLLYAWCVSIPIFLTLWQSWRISGSLTEPLKAFTAGTCRRLRLIARLAYADAAIIFRGALLLAIPNAAQPFFGYVMVPLGILASLVIGVIFQALSQVAAQATGLRDESELTI